MQPKPAITQTLLHEILPRKLTKSEKRRIQILEAAIEAYSSVGTNHVTYEDIAKAAKTSRPLVQHYFPNKGELFDLAIKYVRAQFQELAVSFILKKSDPASQLREYVRSTFHWVKSSPAHLRLWIFFFNVCAHDSNQRKRHRDLTEMGKNRIVALLEEGAKQQVFTKGNFDSRAKAIQRVITGALVELTTELEMKSLSAIQEDTENQVMSIAGAS